ncbi:hypothetical protein F5Y18DRAFT_437196 [Xylariaceae sp. FL1019]|nr:hypothetical protein F5Y18DRAFT_437196 [Xylariaceae sp. FL1019]
MENNGIMPGGTRAVDKEETYTGEQLGPEETQWADPGSKILWFGKHQGLRLDEVPVDYCWYMITESRRQDNPSWNATEFAKWYARFLQVVNPMESEWWLSGEHKGKSLGDVYFRHRLRWIWCLENIPRASCLQDMEEQWKKWKVANIPTRSTKSLEEVRSMGHVRWAKLPWEERQLFNLLDNTFFGNEENVDERQAMLNAMRRNKIGAHGTRYTVDDRHDKTKHEGVTATDENEDPQRRTRNFNGYENPVGKRTDSYDTEESDEDDEPNTDDDNFIVNDEDEDSDEEYTTSQYDSEDIDNSGRGETAGSIPTETMVSEEINDGEESDSSLPSVSQLLLSSPVKGTPRGRAEAELSRPRRHTRSTKPTVKKQAGASGIVWAESSDDDEDDVPFFSSPSKKRVSPSKTESPSKRRRT